MSIQSSLTPLRLLFVDNNSEQAAAILEPLQSASLTCRQLTTKQFSPELLAKLDPHLVLLHLGLRRNWQRRLVRADSRDKQSANCDRFAAHAARGFVPFSQLGRRRSDSHPHSRHHFAVGAHSDFAAPCLSIRSTRCAGISHANGGRTDSARLADL